MHLCANCKLSYTTTMSAASFVANASPAACNAQQPGQNTKVSYYYRTAKPFSVLQVGSEVSSVEGMVQ